MRVRVCVRVVRSQVQKSILKLLLDNGMCTCNHIAKGLTGQLAHTRQGFIKGGGRVPGTSL